MFAHLTEVQRIHNVNINRDIIMDILNFIGRNAR